MKNYKKLHIVCPIFLTILLFILGIFCIFDEQISKTFIAQGTVADFTGITGSPDNATLYDATNTYDYNGDNISNNRKYVYYDTSTSGRNTNTVMSGTPQITVVTHGLNSDASVWSNNSSGNFAYDSDSLIARLDAELIKSGSSGGANVYWAKVNSSGTFRLFNLKDASNINSLASNKYVQAETTNSITDITKHIIIVFETGNSDRYNYKVYEEFNYMLSKIVYDVKALNGGVLPRINLIGHSRGGITNLQYALDHPDMVASVFSLGTPYFGSDTASTDLGAALCQNSEGLYDIIDRNIYLEYYNRWHVNYNRLYSNIDFHALGGYSDSDFVFDSIIESNDQDIEAIMSDAALTAIKWVVKSVPGAVSALSGTSDIADFIISLFRDENYDETDIESYIQIIADLQYVSDDENLGFWANLWDNIVHNIPVAGCPYFMNDLLVDLSSQMGLDEHSNTTQSYGFTTYTKCFRESDYGNNHPKKLSNIFMPAVVHNLEARDDDFINYILSHISIGSSPSRFLYKQTSSTTAAVYGFSGDILTDIAIVPEQIDGFTVTSVEGNLFANKGNIVSIILPNTITTIKSFAFAGLSSLTTITFEGNGSSQLEQIGDGAFADCTSLNKFNSNISGALDIPDSVTSIDCYAFMRTAFTDVCINGNINHIGAGAFAGCSNLNISVSSSNSNYSASGNILYNKTGTIINSAGNISDTVTVQGSVVQILPCAFYGNENLETLHIQGAPQIGIFTFADCENLTDVYCYSYNVFTIGLSAFWKDEFVLYAPHSKQSQYVTAFAGYVNTASSIPVTISFSSDGTVIDTLNTYFGANITGLTNPSKIGYDFAGWYDNIAYTGTVYTNGGLWDTTSNMTVYAKWSPQTYYIYFTGYGSENLADKEVTYDALIGTMPSVSRTGYTFYGWKNQYDEYFTSDMIWQKVSNQTVSSDLRANQYTITYNGNGGTANAQSQSVYYDSVISSFASAYREGYTFIGWNTSADGSGQTVAAPYAYVIDNDITVYAQYTENEYSVTFDKQGGSGGSVGVNATYNFPMPSATAPTKNGYTFLGYYRYADGLGTKYYNADMTSANNWNLSDDTTLFAYWSANSYTVTLDKQGGGGGSVSVNATYNAAMPSGTGTTAPTRMGHTFEGYYEAPYGLGTKYYNADMTSNNVWDVADNATIYAYWTSNIYTVVLQKEGGTGGSNSVDVTYGSPMPSATAPIRTGYIFQGYYSWQNGAGTKFYNADMTSARTWYIADSITLYAYWQRNQYFITFDNQGGSGGSPYAIAVFGSPMPTSGISAPTRQGYVFKGYYDAVNGNGAKYYDGPNMTSVAVWDKTSDATLYAYWEQEEYTITLILYDNLIDYTTTHYGEHIEVDYAPYRTHYEFKGYYSGPNGTGICYVGAVVTQTFNDYYHLEPYSTSANWNTYGNGTLYAYWELISIDYTYSVLNVDDGELPSRTIHITSGQEVILDGNPGNGYNFLHWIINGRYYTTQTVNYTFTLHRSYITGELTIYYDNGGNPYLNDGSFALVVEESSCIAEGSLITLADGTQKRVELLTGNETLLVWNMYTGQFDVAPILFIDHDDLAEYDIINLYFSDGTIVRVIDEHAFWDFDLNEYVFLRQDAAQYIGHWFNKQTYDLNNNMIWTAVQLTNVVITQEYTTAWSPVTYGHLCIYVNGMLSMPGATRGLINIFEVNGSTMTIDQDQFLADIDIYGLFTYDEFAQIFDIPESIFNAFNGQYLKISIGKGLITYDELGILVARYAAFFEEIE